MAREFIYTNLFNEKWQNLSPADADLRLPENHLLKNPKVGILIQGTGGIRKMRWVLPNTGKSGGIRYM